MSARRMFSPKIVDSDAFLDMPISTQALYFHLGMEADDDGFVNPKKIMRKVGVSEDDLKVLITKRFVLPFETGVVVIKHWLINNMIRKDFYKETTYLSEKSSLKVKENKSYTENVNKMLTEPTRSIGNIRLSKDRIDTLDQFENFWKEYPRKVGKGIARRVWNKIKPDEELSQKIINSVSEHKKSDQWKKENGQFIPHPSTFLNQERWDDEVKVTKAVEQLKA